LAPLATAYVRVRPDMKTFKSETEAGMASAVPAAGATGGKSGKSFGEAFGKASGRETDKSLQTWQAKVGAGLGTATAKLAKIGVLAFAGVAAYSLKQAADFQAGVTTLETGAGELRKNLAGDAEGIKRIAVATGQSTQSLIDGLYMINSAGFHGAAGLKVLESASQGAKVGVADLGTVADAVTTLLKDYHLGGDQAAASTSALVATVAAGKTKMDLLGPALAKVLPTASALGIGFGEVGAAIATMTAHGVTARLAATRLNSVITNLAAPSNIAGKAMGKLGLDAAGVAHTLTTKGLVAAFDMVHKAALQAGPEGSPAFVSAMKDMLGGLSGLGVGLQLTGKNAGEFSADAAKIGGVMASNSKQVKGWQAVQGDLNTQIDQFKATMQVAAITLGEKLLPVASKFLAFLVKSHILIPALIVVMGVLTAAILVQAAAWAITPVGLITIAIVALIAIIIVLAKNWSTIWRNMKQWASDAINAIRNAFAWLVDHILTGFGWIIHAAASAFGWIPGIGPKLRAAATEFDKFHQRVNDALYVKDKTVNVKVAFDAATGHFGHQKLAAAGWYVSGGTSGRDSVPILGMPGELVVPKNIVDAGAVDHLRGAIPGFAGGGVIANPRRGITVNPVLPNEQAIEAAIMPPIETLAKRVAVTGVFSTVLGAMIAAFARSFVGHVPYVWGGNSPVTGWDCSGMTSYVYRHFGFGDIPRTAAQQQSWASRIGFPLLGALAFFAGADGTPSAAGHVGIVAGNNLMANAYGTGFGTILSSFASGGGFGGFGVPPGRRFARGGWISEPVAGIGASGRGYQFHGGEAVTSQHGLADLSGRLDMIADLLREVISAVDDNAPATAAGVAGALGGGSHGAAIRAAYSPRG